MGRGNLSLNNMKVYVTYCKGWPNGAEVDKVFDTEEKAINHAMTTNFNPDSYYGGKDNEYLKVQARIFVECFEVE
jgi:hypothetical protein